MSKEHEQIPKRADLNTAFLSPLFSRIITTRSSRGSSLGLFSIRNHICAFLNTDGGKIYCGFDYNRNVVVGIDHPEKYKKEINYRIKKYFDKSVLPFISIFRKKIGKRFIVIIQVSKLPEDYGPYSINGYYYFRIDGKTIQTDKQHLDYFLKIINFGCPLYRSYRPITSPRLIRQKILNERIKVNRIGDLNNKFLYKYMDLESALLSLDNNNIRFVEPNQWDDQYEGRFYTANYFLDEKQQRVVSSDLTPFLYACCFTTKQENEAAWTLYSHNKTGLASRCVEFKLNRRLLMDQIVEFIVNDSSGSGYPSLFFGKVMYESNSIIENVHNRTIDSENNMYYHKYFDSFSLESYLNLLLIKRSSFEHEQEVRIFIIPPDQSTREKSKRMKNGKLATTKKTDPKYVTLRWEDIIEEVRIDKHCSDYEKSLLQKKLDQLFISRIRQLTKDKMDIDENKEKARFTLVDFDPYEDKSLKKGAISVVTN